MVLNETVAIDDYRVSEEWMLSFSTKDYQASRAAKGSKQQHAHLGACPRHGCRVHSHSLRKGPAVAKQAICARIDDSPYRIDPLVVTVPPLPIRTQISFINASQRDGFESTLGPKQQGGMINFTFKGLIDDMEDEVGYIDLTTADKP